MGPLETVVVQIPTLVSGLNNVTVICALGNEVNPPPTVNAPYPPVRMK